MGGSSAGRRRFPDSDIRTELERILSSPVFEASQRNRQFLQYVVEETLAGRSDRIKAYSIATQVFGRGDDFDPLQDSIVRIEAARLRRELEHFYLKQGPGPLVQISIPKGTYVPDFLWPDTSGRAGDTQPANHPVAPQRLHHSAPRILVQTLDEDRHTDHFPALGNKITRQLIMSLTRYTELLVYAFPTSDAWSRLRGTDTAADLDIDYVLGGSVTVTADKLYVDVLLQRNSDGRCIWASQHNYELSPDLSPGDIIGACQAIAGQVTLRIAERDGILDSQARDTMDEPPQSFDGFRKILDFHDYWRGLDPEMFEPLRLDLESTIAADPGFAMAFACLSMMYSNAARYDYDVGPIGQPPLDRALDLARRAIQLAPSSSRAYHARGIAEWFSGMTEESLETLGTALSLNPNDCEVMSELGLRRAMRLEWDLALPLLTESYRRNPLQPANYRMALFFYNFSLGQFEEALKEADATGAPGIAQVHIACSAALSRLGRMQEARERLRIADRILPDLRTRLTEDLTFRQINPGMVHDIVTAIGNVDPGWRPARARQAIQASAARAPGALFPLTVTYMPPTQRQRLRLLDWPGQENCDARARQDRLSGIPPLSDHIPRSFRQEEPMASGSEAAAAINPAATGHLPVFIAFPDQGDWLMMGVGIVLLMMIVGIGVLYLRLHALPEHMAHRGQKVQYEIVAVLALIALFTHNHAFWIAGLLLALIPMPDFMSPLRSMAGALNRIADKPDGSLPPRDPGA